MVSVGKYNALEVIKEVAFGLYLDGGNDVEILLPTRYVPKNTQIGDTINVFIYHDNEHRLVATTDKPVATVGEIAYMEVVSTTPHGAFLKWGIMKDVFLPFSQMASRVTIGEFYFVKLFIDQVTGKVTATEKFDMSISNYELTVGVHDAVNLIVYKKTDIGYKVIINNIHIGLMHFNEVFSNLKVGDKLTGFIKNIRPDHKIDVAPGTMGYAKVNDEEEKILNILAQHKGFIPFNDKSSPEEIYATFGCSKRIFKMTIGALYKKRLISMDDDGIKLLSES